MLYTEWIASIARVASKDFCCKYQYFSRQTHISPKNTSGRDDSSSSMSLKLENFHNLRNKPPTSLFIWYLNINSLRERIIDLRQITEYLALN